MKYITLFIVIFSSLVHAQNKVEKKADPNMRPAKEVHMKFERTLAMKAGVYFKDGILTLVPGDEVHLQFVKVKGKLKNPKVVAKVTKPKQTISFEMTQDEKITMLMRSTAIQETVALDCESKGLGAEEFNSVNLFPTEKGLMSGDSFANHIYMIKLSNIKVTEKSAEEAYEEKVNRKVK